MQFEQPLVTGRLIRRYKRFLADVVLDDGRLVTAHCPNTGSMLGCRAPGLRVWLSPADRHGRRLKWTWEMVETGTGALVGIHTGRSNGLVEEGIRAGLVSGLSGYDRIRREVRHPSGGRTDLVLEGDGMPRYWVEVKNVTAAAHGRSALFPDAVSKRAARHLYHLVDSVEAGERAMLCFCVQRDDIDRVTPAVGIDPDYAAALARAERRGVRLVALGASLSERSIRLSRVLAAAAEGGTDAHSSVNEATVMV